MTTSQRTLNIFYCYAHQDKGLRDELDVHLAGLKRQQVIKTWYDREILPGMEWEKEIDSHLSTAHIVLLLLSPDFLNSDYCYCIEMERALKRHEEKTACIIPILARPVYWKNTPFSKLQILPTGTKPVTIWSNRDEAWWDVVEGIHRTVEEVQGWFKSAAEWYQDANQLFKLKRYEESLSVLQHAILLDPNSATLHNAKGILLNILQRHPEALSAFEQSIHLSANNATAHAGKGVALSGLKRYQEALFAFDEAISLDPSDALTYSNKGCALNELGRYQEAVSAFDQAIYLDPSSNNFFVTGTYGEFDAFFIELEKQIAATTRPLEPLDPPLPVEKRQLSNQPSPIKVFYMYSSSAEDEDLQKKLEAQLSVVRHQGKIIEFKNTNSVVGRGFDSETRRQWEKAEVILVLVSADFLRNDYPLTREDIRRKVQTDKVLPIIVRPVADWQKDFLGTLQVLPNNKQPITRWNNIDEGLAQVAEEIRKEIEILWEKRNGAG